MQRYRLNNTRKFVSGPQAGTYYTVGERLAVDDGEYDGLAADLQDLLEGTDSAIFFTPDEQIGVALDDEEEYLLLYLFVHFVEEGVWARNSPGLVEIRVPADWPNSWEILAAETLRVMPDFDLAEVEEIPSACVGDEDMSECWPEE